MTALRNIGYIVQKEWRHYFFSPIAYVALAFWSLLVGGFFSIHLASFLERAMMAAAGGGYMKPSLNDWVIAFGFQNMTVVALFITPMLTMRLLAEEKRQGTIELLATSPITDLQILLGKFFGALSVYGLMIASSLVNYAWLWRYADTGAAPDWRPMITGALALLLMGGSFIALGLFVSSLTRNQIIAGVVTFALLLLIWILGWLESFSTGGFVRTVAYLGLVNHAEDMIKGVIDLKDVAYYVSFMTFCLFLAHQSMESQRWRA